MDKKFLERLYEAGYSKEHPTTVAELKKACGKKLRIVERERFESRGDIFFANGNDAVLGKSVTTSGESAREALICFYIATAGIVTKPI